MSYTPPVTITPALTQADLDFMKLFTVASQLQMTVNSTMTPAAPATPATFLDISSSTPPISLLPPLPEDSEENKSNMSTEPPARPSKKRARLTKDGSV